MIIDQLTRDVVHCQASAHTWQEAVRMAGHLLERVGACDASYTDAMIASVETFGPYMVLEEGIAMPHAQANNNVSKAGICVVTLATPVAFGHEEFDPVRVLIGICAPDPQAHLAGLGELAQMFEDEDAVNKLSSCTTEDEILNVMASFFVA
ncbi:PTS sugar transporter subunit IIA [Collinsella sp. zg1085]|uniref:PTS sugar transporter subunit IIA n=1 Tax=Collinsella sp. zg1085 TaxID=2844380 RepID=UPI001C0E1E6B|nr:PTS sugar transporter subunit IIA [Collinsella sp. zg1085]QWT17991.1 PTS sugar transporter subunit IIA [Collinsella sp. zg1085]